MALVTAADLKGYTGVHVEDGKSLELYVNSASEIVGNYLGYGLELARYETTLDGNGAREIALRARPITALLRVAIDGREIPTGDFETGAEFLIYKNGVFASGTGNVGAVYEAGFKSGEALEPGEREAALPDTIKGTILRIAALLLSESDGNIGVNSKSFGDSGSRVFTNYTNFDKFLAPVNGWKLIRI